jgi:hypothetical protein
MDFEIARCSRRCAVSDREFAPGEVFYSLLATQGAEIVRRDYSAEHWPGPDEACLGWWKSRMPARDERRGKLAPNDVLLRLFQQLESQPDKQDMRYVLALLLVRRRVFQVEAGAETKPADSLVLYCARDGSTCRVPAMMPDDRRVEQIQNELAQLLFADSEKGEGLGIRD